MPSIYIGNLNSRNQYWRYADNDAMGNIFQDWMILSNIHLVYGAKARGTFRAVRWLTDTTPDLCFITSNIENGRDLVNREIVGSIPHSQHRAILMNFGIKRTFVKSVPK